MQHYTLQQIKDEISETIIGQQMAVDQIAPILQRIRMGVPRGNRPAGAFLFLGPPPVAERRKWQKSLLAMSMETKTNASS